ncbi:MAG: dienelactone hydrolase, partial [Brachymonas sp.]
MTLNLRSVWTTLVLCLLASATQAASLGMRVLPPESGRPEVTLFYPSSSAETEVQRGPFALRLSVNGAFLPDTRKRPLVAISHGSGGAPWPMLDLVRALVDAGYAVA